MSDEENKEESSIKVRDHRRFHLDGTPVEGGEASAEKETTAPESDSQPQESSPSAPTEPPSEPSPSMGHEEIPSDFTTLVFSLAASAQSALGIAPNPMTGQVEKNIPQAKHSINLLEVLLEKTKGNLSDEEAKLLQAILYDLRMRFVDAQK